MSIRLAKNMQWDLFVGMVCRLLEKHEYNGNAYEMATSLDMTFEEVRLKPLCMWEKHIEGDLIDYKQREGRYNFNSNFK